MYNDECYIAVKQTHLQTKSERKQVSVFTLSHQLAYELLPTTSEQILSLDTEMQDLYC